ncbi:MAG: DUF4410 domain-containing protein [Halioglobus sp.]
MVNHYFGKKRVTRNAAGYLCCLPRWSAGAIAALLLLAGCAPTTVTQVNEGSVEVPRPALILVYDFAVSADEVELDKGLSPELMQKYENELSGPARTADEIRIGLSVANAVATELVKKLQSYGLNAQWADANTPISDDTLVIRGQFLTIDEGNRTERVAIGFGVGRTEVQANIQIYELTPVGYKEVETLTASGGSNDKPGMLEMIGIGALTHHLMAATAVSGTLSAVGEVTFETVQSDGKRLADKIAAHLGDYFVSQGWISPDTVN